MPQPLVFDAHVDSLQLALELGADLGAGTPGQLDLPRGRQGGLGAVVFACWVEPKYIPAKRGGARARADALFDCLDQLVARHPDEVRHVRTLVDLKSALREGRLAALAGIEGAHPLESRHEAGDWFEGLQHFFDRGLRVLTLVWNNHLPWIRSCDADPSGAAPRGLTDLGRRLVTRMNELGVLVDLSHSATTTFFDVLEVTTKPVIASHSGCKAVHDHQRNLDDDQLRALAANGGVIGMPFLPSFLDARAQREAASLRSRPEYRALHGETDADLEVARTRYMAASMTPLSIDRLVDHVVHVAEVAGVDHVGLGSDFDGITTTVEGLEDAGKYGVLVEPLLRRGFDDSEVAKILSGNLLRVLQATLPGE